MSNSNWKIFFLAGKLKHQLWSLFENDTGEDLSPVLPSCLPLLQSPQPTLCKRKLGPHGWLLAQLLLPQRALSQDRWVWGRVRKGDESIQMGRRVSN